MSNIILFPCPRKAVSPAGTSTLDRAIVGWLRVNWPEALVNNPRLV